MARSEKSVTKSRQAQPPRHALKAAAYIVKSIAKGKSKEQIVQDFGNDAQLVDMLWSFAYHNGWIKKDIMKDGGFSLTKKGQERISRLLKSFAATAGYGIMYGVAETELLLVGAAA